MGGPVKCFLGSGLIRFDRPVEELTATETDPKELKFRRNLLGSVALLLMGVPAAKAGIELGAIVDSMHAALPALKEVLSDVPRDAVEGSALALVAWTGADLYDMARQSHERLQFLRQHFNER